MRVGMIEIDINGGVTDETIVIVTVRVRPSVLYHVPPSFTSTRGERRKTGQRGKTE